MKRLLLLLLILTTFSLEADTNVTGIIANSTTWTLAGSPYILNGDVWVGSANNPVLTIEAGVVVKGNVNSQLLINGPNGRGALVVNGTEKAPVLFTSTGAAWYGVLFLPAAGPPPSRMSHATIENAGSTGFARGGITVEGNAPTFDHLTIRNHQFAGFVLKGGSATIHASTIASNAGPGLNVIGGTSLALTETSFTNNAGYAATLPVGVMLSAASGLLATGNATGGNAIEWRAGTITAAAVTWPAAGIPYVLSGDIWVGGANNPVLTIEAGVVVKGNVNSQLLINGPNGTGSLVVNGTEKAPVLFTSNGTVWYGIEYRWSTNAPPQSRLSYATIENAGATQYSRGGITVRGYAPAFDHVTIRNNQFAGFVLNGGSASIQASTISSNAGPGLNAIAGTSLSLTETEFTNNAGYAATLPIGVALSASGLLATGNATGGNAIEWRAGIITAAATTWPASGIPYALSGDIWVGSAQNPVLTIEAGVIVKGNVGSQLLVNGPSGTGALVVNGTEKAPVLFTSNGTVWYGIEYKWSTNAPPQSRMSYATIENAGSTQYLRGGITVNGYAPAFDHVTIRNNQFAGFTLKGGSASIQASTISSNAGPGLYATTGTLLISNSHLVANEKGVHTTGSATVQAGLNYWGSAAGPCLPGNCAAGQQSVTTAVSFEPWLLTVPTVPFNIATAVHKNRIFNPSIGTRTWIDYTTSQGGDVALTIRNAGNVVVRTVTAAGTPGSIVWDGKDGGGTVQPNGTYSYELAATAPGQPPAAVGRGNVVIDSARVLTLSNPTATLAFFSPNADSVQDTTTVSAATNYEDATWTVSVLDGASNVVRSQTGTGLSVSFLWDGKNAASVVQPDGLYTLRVEATTGVGSFGFPAITRSTTTTLDNTAPAAVLAAPVNNAVLSNIHTNGSMVHTATGSLSDSNLLNWSMQYGAGAAPTSWSTIGSGSGPVSNATLGALNTTSVTNGTYAFRLRVTDKAGNVATSGASPVTVGNFRATQSAYEFNATTGGTITYTSTVPFQVTESLSIRNLAGTVVRTLVTPVARNAGTYTDAFNGRNDAGALLPDGPYFYSITLTAGASTFTWDLSNVMRNESLEFNDSLVIQPYDPLNNAPLTFNYNFIKAGRVSVATKTSPGSVIGECETPTAAFFCPAVDVWQDSGPQTFTWWGLDHTGAYRTIRSIAIVSRTDKFPQNAAVLYGSKPTLQNVRVTPPIFGPAVGAQTVELDLTTYQSQPATVSIDFVNLESKTTLRTVTVANQTPGHASIHWDGRAYNGLLVAPGRYAVVVTVTDPIGNSVRSGILSTIQY